MPLYGMILVSLTVSDSLPSSGERQQTNHITDSALGAEPELLAERGGKTFITRECNS